MYIQEWNTILSCIESAEKMLLGKSEEQNFSTKIFAKFKDYSWGLQH